MPEQQTFNLLSLKNELPCQQACPDYRKYRHSGDGDVQIGSNGQVGRPFAS